MDATAARARLSSMLDASTVPALSDEEIDDLLEIAKRPDPQGVSPRCVPAADAWTAGTAVGIGTIVRQDTTPDRWWLATNTGTTGTIEPRWPDLTGIAGIRIDRYAILDGTVYLRDAGPEWVPTWDLSAAAAEGWRRKAAKAAADVTVQTGDQTIRSSDLIDHCLRMAAVYAGAGPAGGRTAGGGSITITRD